MGTIVECTLLWSAPLAARDEHRKLLDRVELDRYHSYRTESRRLRFLTGRVLAKTTLADRLGVFPAEVTLDATCSQCGDPHGKPLPLDPGGRPLPFELSVAHSGERVGLAITKGVPVGLDVERADRRFAASVDGLMEYALGEHERSCLSGLAPAARERGFLRYWTRKEALMKAAGYGLRIALSELTVSAPWEQPELLASREQSLSQGSAQLADLEPLPDHPASLATLTDSRVTVDEYSWQPPHVAS